MATPLLEPGELWRCDLGDVLDWLRGLPDDCADLVLTSPPYERARLYLEGGEDLGIARDTEEWVAWMVEVCREARRVCKGLCALVVEGQTKDYRYTCSPFLLAADLHRAGFYLRKPPIYRRVGIPGSGGPDWWRNDYEPVVCFARGGKLPWSDNTACGHPPKWRPGGAMSHRTADGRRVNQLGNDGEPVPEPGTDPWDKHGRGNSLGGRRPDGTPRKGTRSGKPFKVKRCKLPPGKGGAENTEGQYERTYVPPAVANPGNVANETYTAEQVAEILGEPADVIDCEVGGYRMGSQLAHQNEAPFPESLATRFVLSFCPPGGLVLDPFAGSGTTLAVSVRCGRRAMGCDLRASQVELATKRLRGETPSLFSGLE